MVTEDRGSVPRATEVGRPRWGLAAVAAVGWVAVAWVLVQLDWDENAAEFLRVACALAAWAFVWRFSKVDWSTTLEGRHIMGYTFITAIFMTFAAVVTFIRTFPGYDTLIVALYGWLLLLIGERHRLFTLGQKERRIDDQRADALLHQRLWQIEHDPHPPEITEPKE